jgi:hypothetical protein
VSRAIGDARVLVVGSCVGSANNPTATPASGSPTLSVTRPLRVARWATGTSAGARAGRLASIGARSPRRPVALAAVVNLPSDVDGRRATRAVRPFE